MWELINKIADFLIGLFNRYNPSTEKSFLEKRKSLAHSQVWLLDIFETDQSLKLDTFQVFEIWEPIMVERTEHPPEFFSVDGVFTRLKDLEDDSFISRSVVRGKTMWTMSDAYVADFVPRTMDLYDS